VDIRFPNQSLILAGESPEVDTLVSRATPIDGTDRGRAVVPVENTATLLNTDSQRPPAIARSSVGYGRSFTRPSSPVALYQSIDEFGRSAHLPVHLDVFA
jgi:hypothetical protein